LKRNTALVFYVATSVLAASSLLSAQQPAVSPASAKTVNEEEVNEANIQLMRQDIRRERKGFRFSFRAVAHAAAQLWDSRRVGHAL